LRQFACSPPQFEFNYQCSKVDNTRRFSKGLAKTELQRGVASNRRLLNRLARWTGPVILFSIVSFLIGFVVFAERIARMQTPADIAPADAIVVLTGGQFRLEKSVQLLASRKGTRLLVSGANADTSKTDLSRAIGANQSLFECCVDIGYQAQNTVGNANETADWLKRHNFKSVILVTNNYHMPRSVMEIRRMDGSIDVRPYPVVNTDLTNGKWMLKKDTIRVLLAEYIKYIGAKLRTYLPVPNSLSSILGE
jgi:uncharacterized SAM-binding protein YcdF (DUF218 family)